jgi:hypothetical protein
VLAKDWGCGEDATADPRTTLQECSATGELSEAEFEARLERILESDNAVERAVEGLEARAERARHDRRDLYDRPERELASERE